MSRFHEALLRLRRSMLPRWAAELTFVTTPSGVLSPSDELDPEPVF